MRRPSLVFALASILGLAVAGLGAPPASASQLAAPVVTVTQSSDSLSSPIVTWPAIDGAVRYHVKFQDASNRVDEFDTLAAEATSNRDMGPGQLSVSVNAVDDSGVVGVVGVGTSTIPTPAAPVITSPTSNVQGPPGNTGGAPQLPTVVYPQAPALSWQPVAGARSYSVSLTSAGRNLTFTTTTTSVVPNQALDLAVQGQDKVWNWSVTWSSPDGVVSQAASGSFRVIWPSSVTLDSAVAPNDTNIDSPVTPSITDTRLKWSAAPGAMGYEVQIYLSNNFADSNSQVVDTIVRATQYSKTPELGNATYWWRVRPVYPTGSQYGEWSPAWVLQRKWGKQDGPTLSPSGGTELSQLDRPSTVVPVDGSSVAENALVLSWTPVTRASRYEVQWRATGTLTWDGAPSCATFHTSITAQGSCSALPGSGSSVQWRVRAIDDAASNGGAPVYTNWSSDDLPGDPSAPSFTVTARSGTTQDISNFRGRSDLPSSAVPVPDTQELVWPRVTSGGVEYASYRVDLALDQAFTTSVYSTTTRGTHLVPTNDLPDNNAGQAYYYRVVPCTGSDGSSCLSNANAASGQFLKVGTAAHAVVVSDAVTGVPATTTAPVDQVRLTWDPRSSYARNDGAIRGYHVQVSTQPDFSSTAVDATVAQPWYVAPDKLLPNTTGQAVLYTRVQVVSGSGLLLSWSPTTTFQKVAASVTGAFATAGANCGAASSSTFVRSPLLCWSANDLTDHYTVEVDRGAASVVSVDVPNTAWASSDTLQPGSYTWRVRRTDISGNVSAWASAGSFTIGFPSPTALAPHDVAAPLSTLAFSWAPSSSAVTYFVEIAPLGDAFSHDVESVTTNHPMWTPRGQIAAGTYQWRVKAYDSNGQLSSSPSSISAPATISIQTVPGQPQNLNLATKAQAVSVSWTAPSDGGSPLLEYRIRSRIANALTWAVTAGIPAVDGSRVITGLANSQTYDFQVSARNALGWGAWTNTVSRSTADIPGTPGSPNLTNLGLGRVRVDWNAPSDGGAPISAYEVQVRRTGAAWPTAGRLVAGTGTTSTFTGLVGGVQYEARVRARNAAGVGLFGSSQTIAVAAYAPGAPRWVSLTSVPKVAYLRWAATSTNGSRILGYNVRVKVGAKWVTVSAPYSSAAKAYVWKGGVRGRTYSFVVRLGNAVGYGPFSAVKSVKIR